MKYEVITDPTKCQELYNHLEFSIFENCLNKTPFDQSILFDDHQSFFKQYLIQPNFPIKDNRNFLVFNAINGKKDKVNFHAPRIVMVDFDHLSPDEATLYYQQLSSLPATIYCDYSQSGKGVKALIGVMNDYTFDYYFVKREDECVIDTPLFEYIHQQNVRIVSEYLVNNGINITATYLDDKGKKQRKYDPAGSRITQGTYSSNGVGFYFNPLPHFLFYKFIKFSFKPAALSYDNAKTKTKNDDYLAWFINAYRGVEDKAAFQDILFSKFGHSIEFSPFLNILKHVNDERIINFFYQVIKHAYAGTKLRRVLNTVESFKLYIKQLKGYTKFILDSEIFLSDLKSFFQE